MGGKLITIVCRTPGIVKLYKRALQTDKKVVEKCIRPALQVVEEMPGTTNVTYFGIDNINEDGVSYVSCFSAPFMKQYGARIAFFEKVYDEFKKAGIKPFSRDLDVKLKSVQK